VDTYVNYDPARADRRDDAAGHRGDARFGIAPKVALLSHSNFGSADSPTAEKMRTALRLLHERTPNSRWKARCTATPRSTSNRLRIFPNARMREAANLLIFPTSMPPTSPSTC
jgi:malate dehydrogenase (oxaloacetate-decarboxylating)(NADP+)